MKATETIYCENKTLTVYFETLETDETKAFFSYFIDGTEVKDWGKLLSKYQRIFDAMVDNLCEGYNVIKWSY